MEICDRQAVVFDSSRRPGQIPAPAPSGLAFLPSSLISAAKKKRRCHLQFVRARVVKSLFGDHQGSGGKQTGCKAQSRGEDRGTLTRKEKQHCFAACPQFYAYSLAALRVSSAHVPRMAEGQAHVSVYISEGGARDFVSQATTPFSCRAYFFRAPYLAFL